MRTDDIGPLLDRALGQFEVLADRSPAAAVLGGIVLGVGVIVGGLAIFLVVFILLVEVFH